MEELVGASKLDTRVQVLAQETSLLHRQLLALLAQSASKTVSPSPQSTDLQARQNPDDSPNFTRVQKDPAAGQINEEHTADENVATTSGRLHPSSIEEPEGHHCDKVFATLLQKQKELIAAFALTRGQENSKEYKAAETELLTERRKVLKRVALKLHKAEQALDDVLDVHSRYKRPKLGDGGEGRMGEAAVSVEDIISYAHKISYSTFAPPSYLINQELPPGFQPPAPQAEHMRASALYQITDEELGFRPPPSAAPIEMKPEEKLAKPPPGWKPGMPVELPPMPPGWKPGMDLPLPPLALANLPPMPPGWKPGDPVPLPSAQPQAAPSGLLERRPQAQPIQVAHVDLDLNPDLDGGLYSSESEDDESDSEEE